MRIWRNVRKISAYYIVRPLQTLEEGVMNKYFSPLVLAFALAASTISSGFVVRNANAQSSPRPYVVLVNGYQDCCVWDPRNRGVYMETVVRELQQRGAEFRLVPWDTFRDGAGQRSSTSNDAAFLQEAADFINNRLDPNRPLILIGHSFGGDSLLSLAPRINRRIQFLGVIDPTAAGGLREPVTRRGVSSNVDYFFNRWEMNALAASNVVPFDSRLVNGTISGCRARNCDQQEQSLARNENGSEIRVNCESWEVTCDGYNPLPVFMGGSNGTKAKRLAHNDMPSDAYLQRQMANAINRVISNSSVSTQQTIIKIYREILERDVDPSGMTTWTNALASGQSVEQVRRAIAESPEAQNKLNDLYRRMLGRDIDSSGRVTWTNALASGWTLQRVASEGIAPGPEYQRKQAVIQIYREVLERNVDPSGMDTWTRELNSGKTILQVRRAIAESPEAQNKLNDLYRRMLCRDIDSSGRVTWTNALASGWTLQRVASEGIAPSPEYQSRGGRSCN